MQMIVRRTIYMLLLIVMVGVVFHAPLSVGFGVLLPEYALGIKAWKELLLVALCLLVAVEVTRQKMWQLLLNDWLIRLAVIFAAIHFLLLPLMWPGVEIAVAGLMIDLRFIAYFVAVYSMLQLYPGWRRPLLIGAAVSAALSMLFGVLQVTVLPHDVLSHIGYSRDTIVPYLTVDQNYDFIRITGTLRGPNPLGIYAGLIVTVCVSLLLCAKDALRQRHKFLPWVVGLTGLMSLVVLWFTYSRSAKLALAAALAVVLLSRFVGKTTKGVWLALAASALLAMGGLYVVKDTTFVSNVILHEDPEEGGNVNSNDEHVRSLVDGTDRMLRQPLGAGIGSTGSPSLLGEDGLIIENHYLYIAHEVGWFGLAVFLALFGTVLWFLWQRRGDWLALTLFASGVGISVAALFLPVWADDTVAIVWWGLAGIALATPPRVKSKGGKNG